MDALNGVRLLWYYLRVFGIDWFCGLSQANRKETFGKTKIRRIEAPSFTLDLWYSGRYPGIDGLKSFIWRYSPFLIGYNWCLRDPYFLIDTGIGPVP